MQKKAEKQEKRIRDRINKLKKIAGLQTPN